MHTPEGFITSPICVLMLAFYCGALYLAYKTRSHWLNAQMLPRAALLAGLFLLLQLALFFFLEDHHVI